VRRKTIGVEQFLSKRAPAYIANKRCFLLLRRVPLGILQVLQDANGCEIPLDLGALAALADSVRRRDAKAVRRRSGWLRLV
jgi:hypothetical protein